MPVPAANSPTFLGITRTRWAVLCMAGAWVVFAVYLFAPVVEVRHRPSGETETVSGEIALLESMEFGYARYLWFKLWWSPRGAVSDPYFWTAFRLAQYALLLVVGTVGIALLPIRHRYRRSLPGMVRRGALIFFAVAAAGMVCALIDAILHFSAMNEGDFGGTKFYVRYGRWLPPVFFTLAFLSVLQGGEKPARDAESEGASAGSDGFEDGSG